MIKHMNAPRLTKAKKLQEIVESKRWTIEEKFKGNRAWIILGPTNKIISRGGFDRTSKCPHIANCKVPKSVYGQVLDVELYSRYYTDAEVSGFLHRKEGVIPECILPYVFDYLGVDQSSHLLNLAFRRGCMFEILDKINQEGLTVFIPVYSELATSFEQVNEKFKRIIAKGGEGVMLKNLDATYHPGKRPANVWFKIKKSETYDVVILGFDEGEGKYKNMVGSISYGAYIKGQLMAIGNVSGFDDALRGAMTRSPAEYIGNVIEIRCQEMLKSGNLKDPSFVRLRHDKTASECIWKE